MALLELSTLAQTGRLGACLADIFKEVRSTSLLLRGGLGSGKTALTRAIVRHLPNGEQAEVASPSFTICNAYPTLPPILHCDLYRCRENIPEEVWDFLENDGILIVEWAEYLRPRPNEYLDIFLNVVKDAHLANVQGFGPAGLRMERRLVEKWTNSFPTSHKSDLT